MHQYAIIETDDGLSIAEIAKPDTPAEVAASRGGELIDPGPYESYEEAYDVMMMLPDDDEED